MVNFDISKVTLGELKANGVVESYVGYEQVLNAVYGFVDKDRLDSEDFVSFDGKLIGDLVTYWEDGEDVWEDPSDYEVYVRNWFTGNPFDVTGELRRYLESQVL